MTSRRSATARVPVDDVASRRTTPSTASVDPGMNVERPSETACDVHAMAPWVMVDRADAGLLVDVVKH